MVSPSSGASRSISVRWAAARNSPVIEASGPWAATVSATRFQWMP